MRVQSSLQTILTYTIILIKGKFLKSVMAGGTRTIYPGGWVLFEIMASLTMYEHLSNIEPGQY